MIVHIKMSNGCYFHMGKVTKIREDESERFIEVSRRGESPAQVQCRDIASIRIDMNDRVASAAASVSDLPPAA